MHQIKNITKTYNTGGFEQKALDDVTFNLRDNEFVSILGHSGSGKTTLLNIIGGLDRYDSGDIIINGVSTKQYKDRDWDSYRNHSVGFVFQSYNLIPHQSVLANVELALTISGISAKVRKQKAIKALEEVGLKDHISKQPNQLSGGQMQRVAIARALVNEPDVLLADEPTGALDTETSLQIMDLLKKVAKDRLVVMVTHNAELAHQYSNRIIELQDGKVISDSHPLTIEKDKTSKHQNMGKSSMSFLTALSLSFNNLNSKKARTFLTAFAGSIGIIGIALILSLSTGVNDYIDEVQEETMTAYPITIEKESVDFNQLMSASREENPNQQSEENKSENENLNAIYGNKESLNRISEFNSSFRQNNLKSFKKYLDQDNNELTNYVGKNGIVYSYNVNFDLFAFDENDQFINTDGSSFENDIRQPRQGFGPPSDSFNQGNTKISELIPGQGEQIISPVIKDNYQLVDGEWPEEYDEIVLVVNEANEINLSDLYELGILPAKEYEKILDQIDKDEALDLKEEELSFKALRSQIFYLLPSSDYYEKNVQGNYQKLADDPLTLEKVVKEKAVPLKISAIIKPIKDAKTLVIDTPLAYTSKLRNYLMDYVNQSEVVQAQKDQPETNVLNGLDFEATNDKEKIEDVYSYLNDFTTSQQAEFIQQMQARQQGSESFPEAAADVNGNQTNISEQFDQLVDNLDDQALLDIYNSSIAQSSYDENLQEFGVISDDNPSAINIYADNFADKEAISNAIESYNQTVDENEKITYSDFAGLIMSSVSEIVNVITYVLIAFVSVSLLVSSIMIGIITYISVLERTKEIGILRAIGASKRNISTVFNAETIIIGLLSGLLGIGVTYLLHNPLNSLLLRLLEDDVTVSLSLQNALILISLSILLSFIAGLIPSKQASQKNPVDALRSE
ncbi:ABC transporter ATP-binding protein/permease [Facklamia sp. 7083-14-GEN3]|uniref:ABC transporter ATP-binding protein/permease n=1 Tax=Facklamia sp. 7083-14-GEN3 TaxID=2973478 RepID=UPI00215BFEF1|nr:ABC transporter ATP-binding protein/permease [Facklamia sp. 7083-14-GEN3]MCR8969386.1 ABC transporter ATP-binding protein/permease [Facklamia sp. 7083-14-GEN3]